MVNGISGLWSNLAVVLLIGIQVTAGTPGAHNPKVAGTSDGGVVVAWTASGPKYTFVVLQKFDANGNPQWPAMSSCQPGRYPVGEQGRLHCL